MKGLIVAPQPFFSPRGTPFSVYYRTLVTAELGVKLDLLTYGEGQEVDIPGVRVIRIPRFKFLGPIPVGPSLAKLWLDLFIFLWAVGLLLKNRYQFVHAHEEAVFFLRFLKPIFHFKLVYDMHSSLPQQLRNFKFTESRVLIGLFKALEDSCLENADAVITICPNLMDYAVSKMKNPQQHFLIENSIFEDVRLKNRNNSASGDENLPEIPAGRIVVGYAGTFERYQGIDVLLRAFPKVLECRPDAFLLMVGGTPPQVEKYSQLARELNIADACLFTGRISQRAVRGYLQKAAVLTSPRVEGTNTPLKVYEQLASGLPLAATRIVSHTQVLSDDVCFLAEPEPESMAEGILAALNDSERREKVVAGARSLYEQKYSRVAYTQKMKKLLQVLS